MTYLSGGPDVIPETSIISGKTDMALTTPDTTVKAIIGQGAKFKIIGMLAGLGFAFSVVVLGKMAPGITRAFLPLALVTQSMPLVALTPLLVLLFGRGVSVMLAITMPVTFFPAFLTMSEGLRATPRPGTDLVRAYGGGNSARLKLVSIPFCMPYIFTAARLALPRALLGVMIAEWLATGTGLGNLLNQSRGSLDYTMIWTVAAIAVLIAVLLYQALIALERATVMRIEQRRSVDLR